jgi:hypothetical protein
MKPIAVTVEVIFGEIFVVLYSVAFANFANLCPGLGLDFDEFNIGSVVGFIDKVVAEFVQELERMAGGLIIEVIWGRKTEALAWSDLELWVIGGYFSDELL